MKGAPLRFAGAVVGGWIVGRIVVLLPAAVPPVAIVDRGKKATATIATIPASRPPAGGGLPPIRRVQLAHSTVPQTVARLPAAVSPPPPIARRREPAQSRIVEPPSPPAPVAQQVAGLPSAPSPPARLTIDGWLVARPGGGDTLAFGQLGASQGGVRLTYPLDRRWALSGRASAPLRGTGRELGVGLDFKPTRLPVHLLVEQRIDLGDGSMRPAATLIAGGAVALPGRARIDAYGQAGAVRRRGGFVDGALLATRAIGIAGPVRLDIGAGAWGAAQRGAARLDVGPSIALVAPGAGGTLRLQFDYGIM